MSKGYYDYPRPKHCTVVGGKEESECRGDFPGIYKIHATAVEERGRQTAICLLLDHPGKQRKYKGKKIWCICQNPRSRRSELRGWEKGLWDPAFDLGSVRKLEGTFISTELSLLAEYEGKRPAFEWWFWEIKSFDPLGEFKRALDDFDGNEFTTELPIFNFLRQVNRTIEPDGSIKLNSSHGDMRIHPSGKCSKYDPSNQEPPSQDDLDEGPIPEADNFRYSERENDDFYEAVGGDGGEDVYLSDGIYIRPDGSSYEK